MYHNSPLKIKIDNSDESINDHVSINLEEKEQEDQQKIYTPSSKSFINSLGAALKKFEVIKLAGLNELSGTENTDEIISPENLRINRQVDSIKKASIKHNICQQKLNTEILECSTPMRRSQSITSQPLVRTLIELSQKEHEQYINSPAVRKSNS